MKQCSETIRDATDPLTWVGQWIHRILAVVAAFDLASAVAQQADPGSSPTEVDLTIPGYAFANSLDSEVLIRGSILLPSSVSPTSATWALGSGDPKPLNYGSDHHFELLVTNLPSGKSPLLFSVIGSDQLKYQGFLTVLSGDFYGPQLAVDGPAWLVPAFSLGGAPVVAESNQIQLTGMVSDNVAVRRLHFTETLPPDASGAPGSGTTNLLRDEDIVVGTNGVFTIPNILLPEDRQAQIVLKAEDPTGNLAFLSASILGSKAPAPAGPAPGIYLGETEQTVPESVGILRIPFKVGLPNPKATAQVQLRSQGGSATEGLDFQIESASINLGPGEYFGSFAVEILNDSTAEPNESLVLELRVTSEGVTSAPVRLNVTLVDDDSPGAVSFVAPQFIVNEAAGRASLNLVRTGAVGFAGTASYSLEGDADLLANAGSTQTGSIAFPEGKSEATLQIPLLNDPITQGSRRLTVRLSQPSGGMSLGENSTTVLTVRDDETPPSPLPQSVDRYSFAGKQGVNISFWTESGFRYVIDYSASPETGDWSTLATLVGNDSMQSVWDSTEKALSRFYRYRIENSQATIPGK
jgi:Calx-beta domain